MNSQQKKVVYKCNTDCLEPTTESRNDIFSDKLHSTILIVDDEEAWCQLLSNYLQELGYNVITAQNANEAINLCKQQNIDLVLLDVIMPEMDGFTAFIEIRKLSNVPIIMQTTLSRPEHNIRSSELGANSYLIKPYTQRDLKDKVSMVLNQPNVQYIPQLENNPKRTVLTKREKEVLGYLCKGYSIREIGGALFVSERTVRTHCSNILTTLSMNSLKELILFVEKVGFENL